MLVFVRLGTAFMFMPGLSAPYVPTMVKVFFTTMVTVVSVSAIGTTLPAMPESGAVLVLMIAMEVLVGSFLGVFGQFLLAALQFAGTIMGFSTGLMMAQAFDASTSQQGSLIASFVADVAMVLLFVMGMHHVMIMAIIDSYQLFPPGQPPLVGDMASMLSQMLDSAFRLGWQFAAPFVVYQIVFNVILGVMARLMPQLQVMFIAMPMQILLGLAMVMMTLPFLMMSFLSYFEEGYMALFIR